MDIKKLNQINIKDIPELLKSIDVIQIVQSLKQKGSFINIILMSITLLLSALIFTSNQKKSAKLYQKIPDLETKLGVVKQYDSIQKDYVTFKKNFQKPIAANELIEKISELGSLNNVQILSLSPSRERNDGYLDIFSLQVSANSSSYEGIVNFIKSIEELPFAIRLKEWSGNTNESDQQTTDQTAIDLEIESFKLKKSNE